MGLDMYLYKDTYVQRWDHHTPEETFEVVVTHAGAPYPEVKPERVSYVVETVAYWRKANQVHGWFVRNVQDGVDNCRKVYVPAEKLVDLVLTCREVLEDRAKAKELLPVTPGFFFGNYDETEGYDEWYFKDLEYTAQTLGELLAEGLETKTIEGLTLMDANGVIEENPTITLGDYYYESSW
jgi:hypothetical protein